MDVSVVTSLNALAILFLFFPGMQAGNEAVTTERTEKHRSLKPLLSPGHIYPWPYAIKHPLAPTQKT